jgi:lysyl-tRNA synthetase class 2
MGRPPGLFTHPMKKGYKMTSRLERITQQRIEKLNRIKHRGINPYPNRYRRTHTAQQAIARLEKHEASSKKEAPSVSVAGRIMANRRMLII